MTPQISVPIRSGSRNGLLFWHVEKASFGARFAASDRIGGRSAPEDAMSISNSDLRRSSKHRSRERSEGGSDRLRSDSLSPGSALFEDLVIGARPVEFPTIDRLVNHLALIGMPLDAESIEVATTLRARVTATFGDVEFVGIERGARPQLLIVRPDLRTVAVRRRIESPEYGFGWGTSGAGAIEAARAMLGAAWSTRWGPDEEMCVEALVHHLLADCGPVFSVTANSLCDFHLFDEDLSTALTDEQLDRIAVYQPE